ncbi:ParB/RepB/Spo0J family partition protein [Gordonia humi]|uniref:ParB family chromosome partitioning protein n=1 Tax=Gordonia humi TaxID=686429 RepID=A0A840FEV0_9ACTN|nr:ParB N-terminal domain-containing protein [Gordonia humi]MBB4137977.1 ParB family chromosome partitioning protein [Gordonia humi]
MATKRGGRVDLSTLGSSVSSDTSPVDRRRPVEQQFRANVPLEHLTPNPRNPRDTVGSLDDLASIAERQLQPATVITKARWLELWPEDRDVIGEARWIVVNGCRRLAAGRQYGRAGLDVVVQDTLATTRESIIWAAIAENIDRQNLDVVEEAKAVGQLVAELGSANAAAERLGRSATWISQRKRLLDLHPDLQEEVRAGEMAIRDAREIGRLPMASQVEAWSKALAKREQQGSGEGTEDPADRKPASKDPTPASAVRALKRLRADPTILASALIEVLDTAQIDIILETLGKARQGGH